MVGDTWRTSWRAPRPGDRRRHLSLIDSRRRDRRGRRKDWAFSVELTDYLQLARRNWLVLLAFPVLLAAAAFVYTDQQPRQFASTATILLRVTEQVATASTGSAEVNAAALPVIAKEARGPDVLTAAAAALGGGVSSAEIDTALKITPAELGGTLDFRATAGDPQRAADIANAVGNAFIEIRRTDAVEQANQTIATFDIQIADLSNKIDQFSLLPDNGANRTALASAQGQFQDLSNRRLQLEADVKLKKGAAEVVQVAQASGDPVSRKPLEGALIGLGAGLAMAIGFALLRDLLDQRLRSRDEAEELSGLSVLAQLPLDQRTLRDNRRIAVLAKPDGVVAEAVRSLRVSMRFLSVEKPLRVVLVTSASPGDGKSTLATNLAASYAAGGFRTLLISADLRRPQVERLTELEAGPGLVEILSEMAEEEELRQRRHVQADDHPDEGAAVATAPVARRRTERAIEEFPTPPARRRRAAAASAMTEVALADLVVAERPAATPAPARNGIRPRRVLQIVERAREIAENLWVLPGGQAVTNPVEILGSPLTKDLFALAAEQFDMVIVDSPPVLPVSDALIMAHLVDGIIFVTSLRSTNHSHLERGVEAVRMTQARLLGLVLNRVPQKGRDRVYGYYGK